VGLEKFGGQKSLASGVVGDFLSGGGARIAKQVRVTDVKDRQQTHKSTRALAKGEQPQVGGLNKISASKEKANDRWR